MTGSSQARLARLRKTENFTIQAPKTVLPISVGRQKRRGRRKAQRPEAREALRKLYPLFYNHNATTQAIISVKLYDFTLIRI